MASVYKHPNFAVLCSFLERYGQQLQLPDLTIPELQIALERRNISKMLLIEICARVREMHAIKVQVVVGDMRAL